MLSFAQTNVQTRGMKRRDFLLQSSAALAAASLPAAKASTLVDCHVYLGSNPFRGSMAEEPKRFADALRQRGVTEAWAGAFEGMLRRDVAAVNRELAKKCRGSMFLPCGTVNLALPDWQDDVRRCAEVHGMRVVRLHPNYQGFSLDGPAFRELLALAVRHRLVVQIVAQMEDGRTQHPRVQVTPVDLAPLRAALKEMNEARVMLLNANAAMVLRFLQDCPGLWLDFAMIEGVGGVATLLTGRPIERLVFGSFAPVFYWESARLKMDESALDEVQMQHVLSGNAGKLLS